MGSSMAFIRRSEAKVVLIIHSNLIYLEGGTAMKKYSLLTCLFVFLLTSTNVFAFDGQRKGFILGVGIGGGFLSNKASFSGFSNTESQGVIVGNFKIGYAPSNSLEIYYMSKTSWWGESDVTLLLGVSAIGASKYLGTSETGFFVSGGIGLSIFDAPFEEGVDSSTGFGLFGGAGYEFSKHWSVEANILYSKISEEAFGTTVDIDSFGVRVSINVLAF